ncbi:M12 family metallopeptidase [Streptosporangium sp. NBC_01469]|uniref:M12 family metallopeptidase n=1 Tax=Streptosporangium sp. NBC_01469 TaxID=2903898 RepID=UPI002E2C3CCF|nr:M12 family metallopeptidase [Streptosporangium sp. NBC_01469]
MPMRADDGERVRHCSLPPYPAHAPPDGLEGRRREALLSGRRAWLNGTVLHYCFLGGQRDGAQGDGGQRDGGQGSGARGDGGRYDGEQREVVRRGFQEWKDLGIGLEFAEVADHTEAEVRIGFRRDAGSWSAVGRDALRVGTASRTVNFGWDLTGPHGRGAVLHQIGHVIGMVHEHQSPYSGILWDEEAVYEDFAGPPNLWPRSRTFHNVIRRLDESEANGPVWDPLSVMGYRFGPGLILEPPCYRAGIAPPGTVSELDAAFARRWYPLPGAEPPPELSPFRSAPLGTEAGEQRDFVITPRATRDYTVGVFGECDTVLVLFEEVGGDLRYLAGDDDGGHPHNASLRVHLLRDRRYVLRARVHSCWGPGQAAVMCW